MYITYTNIADDFDWNYELSVKQEKKIKEIVRKEILSRFSGTSDNEKIIALCKEYEYCYDGEDELEYILEEFINDCLDEDDDFIDMAKDMFRDDAYEEYKETMEYRRDPYGYYGVHISDFI